MIVFGSPLYPEGIVMLRHWINKHLDNHVPEDSQFIGRIKNGEICAVCAFSSYTGDDIELSVAAKPGSGTAGFVNSIFGYIFGQLNCVRCTVRIKEGNFQSINLARRIGFKYEGRQRKAVKGVDLLLYGLLNEELKFYGKRTKTASAS